MAAKSEQSSRMDNYVKEMRKLDKRRTSLAWAIGTELVQNYDGITTELEVFRMAAGLEPANPNILEDSLAGQLQRLQERLEFSRENGEIVLVGETVKRMGSWCVGRPRENGPLLQFSIDHQNDCQILGGVQILLEDALHGVGHDASSIRFETNATETSVASFCVTSSTEAGWFSPQIRSAEIQYAAAGIEVPVEISPLLLAAYWRHRALPVEN